MAEENEAEREWELTPIFTDGTRHKGGLTISLFPILLSQVPTVMAGLQSWDT